MTIATKTTNRVVVPAATPARTGHLNQGEPAGTADRITVTSRYLERNGSPFLPVMGEYHYARSPRAVWREELAAIRAGGVTVVATYVFWILHEEEHGTYDWSGNRDLRHFLELCHELGLDVVVRIGPWGHGETRNGAFPDWIVERHGDRARTDDPAYLADVEPYLEQVGEQLTGLFHVDGGPIIGVQLENELYDQPGHIRSLRRMAERIGMRPAIWTATGWGGAEHPANEVVPLYAGYSDAFWEDWRVQWPDSAPLHFLFTDVRDDLSVGADVRAVGGTVAGAANSTASDEDGVPDDALYPYATCELGGGMHVAYHRRPLVDPEDVAALALTKLGSGSAWQGYYMYHGGSQGRVANGPTQESHATDYPNDLAQYTYDFRAPLGEFGQVRRHFHLLRAQHLFIHTFGHLLAPLPLVLPETLPSSPTDRDTLRWSVRSDGDTGFLFVNNHQPAAAPLPAHADVQFDVDLNGTSLLIPSEPVTIPTGASFVWPLALPLPGDATLQFATAQLVTVVDDLDGTPVYVLAAQPDIPVEVVVEHAETITGFGSNRDVHIEAAGDDTHRLTASASGGQVTVTGPTGSVRLLIVSADEHAELWTATVQGRSRLLRSTAVVLEDALDGAGLTLRTGGTDTVAVWPASDLDAPGSSLVEITADGELFRSWQLPAVAEPVNVAYSQLREGTVDELPAPRTGPLGRASVPDEAAWAAAAQYRFEVPAEALTDTHRAFLRIDWAGDIARLVIDGEIVSDQFFAGDAFEVDLNWWADRIGGGIELHILPWRHDAEVFLDPRVRDRVDHGTARVDNALLHVETLHRAWA
ncbi:hypothetical protein DEJ17_15795 [Curtobacterium sp. MCSS17_011]|uniref:beta-galactosidase n=1 Tax=Curtobacterium sp. MCSS17_011 TaxID=2175643 RepID=UPI000D98AA5C|nr:beta-galactosidase [Curtobacterium sp. MCSS17_011]PYY52586.1 hypothetical protein DEJ17_15795 [Curtobacterium sp. MCSS17_011]